MILHNPSPADLSPGLWWLRVEIEPEAPAWIPARLEWFPGEPALDEPPGWVVRAETLPQWCLSPTHPMEHVEGVGWVVEVSTRRSYPVLAFTPVLDPVEVEALRLRAEAAEAGERELRNAVAGLLSALGGGEE